MNDPRVIDSITLTVELTRDEYNPDIWVSRCVELDIVSFGSEPHTAFEALAEAIRMVVDHCVEHRNETPMEAIRGYASDVKARKP